MTEIHVQETQGIDDYGLTKLREIIDAREKEDTIDAVRRMVSELVESLCSLAFLEELVEKCPECEGSGCVVSYEVLPEVECSMCCGDGKIPLERIRNALEAYDRRPSTGGNEELAELIG